MNALSKVELWLNNDEVLYKRVNNIVIDAWTDVQQNSIRPDASSRKNECMFIIRDSLAELVDDVHNIIVDQLDTKTLTLVGSDIFKSAIYELDLAVLALRLLNGREDDYIKEYGKL